MKTPRNVDVLVLGAGVGGLAAADQLAIAGRKPFVVDRGDVPGGLMQSIKHSGFTLDLGRKELANQIPCVDQLWTEILGDDFRPFNRRCGILHDARIFETERGFAGLTYGMPKADFLKGVRDLAASRLKRSAKIKNYEDQIYQRIGKTFAQFFYQGYDQKIGGTQWSQLAPEKRLLTKRSTSTAGLILKRAFTSRPIPVNWKHPRWGSGQICTAFHERATSNGAEFLLDSHVLNVTTEHNLVRSVKIRHQGECIDVQPKEVVSSLPVEILSGMLNQGSESVSRTNDKPRRSTICVYLFLNQPPKFPHSWLKVTCPKLRVARITNYKVFSSSMVPEGQTCLCAEYCCVGEDPLMDLDDNQLRELAVGELGRSGLIDSVKVFDHLVKRLPGVDGATDLNDWWTLPRRQLRSEIARFENLYCICQPGTNYATWCGMEAARAIVAGDRQTFESEMDPAVLFDSP